MREREREILCVCVCVREAVGEWVCNEFGHLHMPEDDSTVQWRLVCDSVALLDVCARPAQKLYAHYATAPARL